MAVAASVEADVTLGLAERGWHVCPSFIDEPLRQALEADVTERIAEGCLRSAGTGTGAGFGVRQDVRGDSILWLEPPGGNPAQQQVLARFEALRTALNRELQLGLFGFECHYAAYPAGTCYRRHLDQLAGDERRLVSAVLYLNAAWTVADGGKLRLYLGEHESVDVLPEGGTLVIFLSARFEHEVLPARRQRLSLAGWFRRRGGDPVRDAG